MTVKLIKRKKNESRDEKQEQAATESQMVLTTRGWIEEFKVRKARVDRTLRDSFKSI